MSNANDEKSLAIKTNITLAASARNETIQWERPHENIICDLNIQFGTHCVLKSQEMCEYYLHFWVTLKPMILFKICESLFTYSLV